jgi:hypothetical protein
MTVRNHPKSPVAIFAVDDTSKFMPRSGVYERAFLRCATQPENVLFRVPEYKEQIA